MGRGSQDGSPVPGSVEDTPPPHSADGRRRSPNASCPCTESEEGASIGEGHSTRIPQHGGLEAHPDRVLAGNYQELAHFPRLHPMAAATINQSYNSNIVAKGNSRGRTMGGGTIPTRTYTSAPMATMGMGPTKPPSSRPTSTSVRENDSRLAPIPQAARQEMQLPRSFDGHLSRMWIIEMWCAKVRSFL
jgi:hypothetical protein